MGTEKKDKSVVNDQQKPKSKNRQVKSSMRAKNNREVLRKDEP